MSLRNSILLLALLVLPASWALAQYGGGGQYGGGYYGDDNRGPRMRVSGCLYGDTGYLTLFDDNGNTYVLSGRQSARLGQYIGHRVSVEGRTFYNPDNPSAMAGPGEDVPTLRVFQIEHVSRNRCDYGWGGRGEGGINIHIP